MTPNSLARVLILLIEEIAPPHYDRGSGCDQPISRDQWLELNARWQTLFAMNCPREVDDERTNQS